MSVILFQGSKGCKGDVGQKGFRGEKGMMVQCNL